MSEWMYLNGGEQAGPEAEANIVSWIQTGQLAPDTMVWQEGMADWVPANSAIEGAIPPAVLEAMAAQESATTQVAAAQSPQDLKFRNYRFASVAGIGKATRGLLVVATTLAVLGFLCFAAYAIFPPDSFMSSPDLVGFATMAGFTVAPLICLSAFVCLCVWQFRAAVNVAVFEQDIGNFSPGWAAGGYLVPLANFYIPFTMMTRIWALSFKGKDDGNKSLLVAFWWLSWCAFWLFCLCGPAFVLSPNRETSAFLVGVMFFVFALLIGFSGFSLVAIIKHVSARQDERAQELVTHGYDDENGF